MENKNEKQKFTNLETKYKEFQKSKNLVTAYSSNTYRPNDSKEGMTLAEHIKKAQDEMDDDKKIYYDALSELNVFALSQIKDVYSVHNPFLYSATSKFIDKFKALDSMGMDQFASVNHQSSVKKAIPFIGGDLSFEMLIDGLGRFLAERIKDELTAHVFSKINEWLDQSGRDDPFSEFKVILPRTTNFLKTLDANGLNSFGEEIKQYIEDDINDMLKNAVNLKDTPRLRALVQQNPDLDFAFEALEIMPLISEIKSPIEYFDLLENSRNISRWKVDGDPIKHNLANTIHFTSMLAHSMIVMDNGEERFAGTDFITSYVGEEEFMRLYFGFLYQQNSKYYDIHFLMNRKRENSTDTTFQFGLTLALDNYMKNYEKNKSDIQKVKAHLGFFKNAMMGMSEHGKQVYIQAAEIRKLNKLDQKVSPEMVHSFIDELLNTTENGTKACDTMINYIIKGFENYSHKILIGKDSILVQLTPLNLKEKTASFIKISRTCNDAWMDVANKKYALGLIKLLEVPGQLGYPESDFDLFQKVISITDKLSNISSLEKNENWYSVIDIIISAKDNDTLKIRKELKAAAIRLTQEVTQLIIYEEQKNPTSKVISEAQKKLELNLHSMATLLRKITNDDKWIVNSTAEYKKIQEFLKSSEFKYSIISYYSGIELDAFISELKIKLENNKIAERKIFSDSAEVQTYISLVDSSIIKTFNYFMLNKKRDKGKSYTEMLNAHDKLINWTKVLLLLIPSKLEWKINPNVVKVIHLVNDLAVAQNSEDIENIIEHFALPPGSSSIKRKSDFNVSLNAYPGIIGGVDLSWKNNSSYLAVAGTASFTAPVGFAFSWGLPKGASSGIFISVIDIGAVTRFRFADDTTSTLLTKIRFQDILAPGIYYSLGFKKSPISLNIGAQYGPELRTILPDGSGTFLPSMRFGVGITVDIPLFNLYTRPNF